MRPTFDLSEQPRIYVEENSCSWEDRFRGKFQDDVQRGVITIFDDEEIFVDVLKESIVQPLVIEEPTKILDDEEEKEDLSK